MDIIQQLADELRSISDRHNLAIGLMVDPDDRSRAVFVLGTPRDVNIVEYMELRDIFERFEPRMVFVPMKN